MASGSAFRTLYVPRTAIASSSRVVPARAFSTSASALGPKEALYNPWRGKAHVRPAPSVPPPVIQLFPQRVVATDGSTFMAYTTAPTPQTIVLTRDTLNNPLWAPGTERRQDEVLEGRVGRFRKMYGGMPAKSGPDTDDSGEGKASKPATPASFAQADLDWMSDGAQDVKAPSAKGPKKKTKRR